MGKRKKERSKLIRILRGFLFIIAGVLVSLIVFIIVGISIEDKRLAEKEKTQIEQDRLIFEAHLSGKSNESIASDLGLDILDVENVVSKKRREKIEEAFSAWDGSHMNFVRELKQSLNDPRSFEMVKTTYRDNGEVLMVYMTFRAKNPFGALILSSATAICDLNGNVLTWQIDE